MKRMNTQKTVISDEEKIKFEHQRPNRLYSSIIDWQHILFIKIEETLTFQRITAEMLNFTNIK